MHQSLRGEASRVVAAEEGKITARFREFEEIRKGQSGGGRRHAVRISERFSEEIRGFATRVAESSGQIAQLTAAVGLTSILLSSSLIK